MIFTAIESISYKNQFNLSGPNPSLSTLLFFCLLLNTVSSLRHLLLSNINVPRVTQAGIRIALLTCLNPLPSSQLAPHFPEAAKRWLWWRGRPCPSVWQQSSIETAAPPDTATWLPTGLVTLERKKKRLFYHASCVTTLNVRCGNCVWFSGRQLKVKQYILFH